MAVFKTEKSDERVTVTPELGFPGASKATDFCICVREQAAAFPCKIISVYLHEEQREGDRFMVIRSAAAENKSPNPP